MKRPEPRIKIGDTIKVYTMGGLPQYDGGEFVVSALEYYENFDRPVDQYCAYTNLTQSPYMVVFHDGRGKHLHWEDFCEVVGGYQKMDSSIYDETMQAMEIVGSLK